MKKLERKKILLSAFSCEPHRGSEPAVGWNIARSLAKHHDVWVLTHDTDNRPAIIEQELAANPVPNLHFVYHKTSNYFKVHEWGRAGEQINYYLWQMSVYLTAKKLHREQNFDLIQHVTFVRYWTPTLLYRLGAPFIWGPIGGGESSPKSFVRDFSLSGKIFEFLRDAARKIGELDPFVRQAARRCTRIISVTEETAARVKKLGANKVEVISQCALNESELESFSRASAPDDAKIKFISIGRLLHWKGFYLGLKAFAKAEIENSEYLIVGAGPDEKSLKALAGELGIEKKIRFCGAVSRGETFHLLAESHVLVHPSLHDSGSFACLEAMAAKRPVICLDLGGPAVIVSDESGVKVSAENPQQAIAEIAAAMSVLAHNRHLRAQMGEAAQERAFKSFNWETKIAEFNNLYAQIFEAADSVAPATGETLTLTESNRENGRRAGNEKSSVAAG